MKKSLATDLVLMMFSILNRAIRTILLKALGTQISDDEVRLNLVIPAPKFSATYATEY